MILDYTFLFTTIISAIAAIWIWYTKAFLPSQQEFTRDRTEHRQKIELDTLQKALELLEETVKHLMMKDKERDVQIAESLEKMSRSMIRLEDMNSIVIQDWQRSREQMEEVLSDIDMSLTEIKKYMNGNSEKFSQSKISQND